MKRIHLAVAATAAASAVLVATPQLTVAAAPASAPSAPGAARTPPPGPADEPRAPRLPRRHGHARRRRPATRRTSWRSGPRSARSGPTPTAVRAARSPASAAARTTRPPTPGARAPTTPTTWPAPPSSTSATGSRPAPRTSRRRGVPDAARPDLPADRDRPERRQRRALDAARRHPEPQRRAQGAAGPRPTATRPTGSPARPGRSARATPPSRRPTPRSPASSASGWTCRSPRSTGRCSSKDGTFLQVDGRRTPAWLIAQGADASAEAVLGLAAYVRAGGSAAARHALARLSDGIARLSGGDARAWPFGGVLPWALSRSDWHAWSSQMPAALAERRPTSSATGRWRAPPPLDSFTFDPWMLTSGGPDNGRLPTRTDANQIAYGADSRVQSLIATGGDGGQPARRRRGRVVLRRQRLERPDLRPGHRRHLRRGRRRRHRQPQLRRRVDDPRAAHHARARRAPRRSARSRRPRRSATGSRRPSLEAEDGTAVRRRDAS